MLILLIHCFFPSITFYIVHHLLFTCSTYSAIRSRYADILRGSDNLRSILKTPPRRLSSYVYALLTHRDFVLQRMNTPSQEGDIYQEHIYTLVRQVKIGLFMDDKNSNSNSNSKYFMLWSNFWIKNPISVPNT